MQTILVFRTTKLECWSRKFAGIQAFARNRDWRLQTIVCTGRTILVAPLLDFWHPAGCIVESDGASTNIRPRDFGKLPAVFLDHSPELVRDDSTALGAIADRTGWPSTLVLSRYVRRRTGKTLSELRRATSRA